VHHHWSACFWPKVLRNRTATFRFKKPKDSINQNATISVSRKITVFEGLRVILFDSSMPTKITKQCRAAINQSIFGNYNQQAWLSVYIKTNKQTFT